MAAGEYDIKVDQGSTFKFHLTYQSGNTGIDLANYRANMQVRGSFSNDRIILSLEGTTAYASLTGGGSTGYFTGTGGVVGTGGAYLNVDKSGSSGTTGGLLLQADFGTMQNVPHGRHFYDIELTNLTPDPDEVTRILKGSYTVDAEVTR